MICFVIVSKPDVAERDIFLSFVYCMNKDHCNVQM